MPIIFGVEKLRGGLDRGSVRSDVGTPPADGWRLKLVKELKAAGLSVDANPVF